MSFDVCHVEGEDLIRHLKKGRYEQASVDIAAGWHGADAVGIDVGANIGFFTLGVLAASTGGQIYAFEPNPRTFVRLGFTLGLNDLRDRVEAHAIALANTEGLQTFACHDPRSSSGDGLRDTGRAGDYDLDTVPTATLDSFVASRELQRVDWLKMDVEGAEILVLRGAVATLERFRPKMLFEAHPVNLAAHGILPAELYDFLVAAAYRIAPLDEPDGDLTVEQFIARVEARAENFLAFPIAGRNAG